MNFFGFTVSKTTLNFKSSLSGFCCNCRSSTCRITDQIFFFPCSSHLSLSLILVNMALAKRSLKFLLFRNSIEGILVNTFLCFVGVKQFMQFFHYISNILKSCITNNVKCWFSDIWCLSLLRRSFLECRQAHNIYFSIIFSLLSLSISHFS